MDGCILLRGPRSQVQCGFGQQQLTFGGDFNQGLENVSFPSGL